MITIEGLDNILVRLQIALCSPAYGSLLLSELNSKADDAGTTAALALKADAAATTTALNTKLTRLSGTWAARPVTGLADGMMYFASDESTPYWYKSTGPGTKWFDATGTEHV
jgi:hypothetical protein